MNITLRLFLCCSLLFFFLLKELYGLTHLKKAVGSLSLGRTTVSWKLTAATAETSLISAVLSALNTGVWHGVGTH